MLERPNVACYALRPCYATLIGGRADTIVAGINGRVAGQQRMGPGRATVIGQWPKVGIGYHLIGSAWEARRIGKDIVMVGSQCDHTGAPGREEAVVLVTCDNGVRQDECRTSIAKGADKDDRRRPCSIRIRRCSFPLRSR